MCQDCKLAITYLGNLQYFRSNFESIPDTYLDDDANEADIIAALEKVCDQVPESYKMECDDIIDTYGTRKYIHL